MPRTRQEDDPKVAALTEQLAAARMQLGEAAERERRFTIERKVAELKLPALRPHVQALYELALADDAPKTVTFTEKGNTAKETPPSQVVDQLVAYVNGSVAKLLTEFATSGSSSRDGGPLEDPGAEVDRLTKLKAKADKLSYSEAMTVVLADPENTALKEAYARGGGAA
jgi:hypothetical protein